MDGEKEWITWHSIGIKRNQFFQTNFCAYGEAKQLAEKQDLNFIYIYYIYIFFLFIFKCVFNAERSNFLFKTFFWELIL